MVGILQFLRRVCLVCGHTINRQRAQRVSEVPKSSDSDLWCKTAAVVWALVSLRRLPLQNKNVKKTYNQNIEIYIQSRKTFPHQYIPVSHITRVVAFCNTLSDFMDGIHGWTMSITHLQSTISRALKQIQVEIPLWNWAHKTVEGRL